MKIAHVAIEKIEKAGYTFRATKTGCIIRKYNGNLFAEGPEKTFASPTQALKYVTKMKNYI